MKLRWATWIGYGRSMDGPCLQIWDEKQEMWLDVPSVTIDTRLPGEVDRLRFEPPAKD